MFQQELKLNTGIECFVFLPFFCKVKSLHLQGEVLQFMLHENVVSLTRTSEAVYII